VYNKKWIEKQELIAQMALPVTTFCKIPKPIKTINVESSVTKI
jgi:hypothetical protein